MSPKSTFFGIMTIVFLSIALKKRTEPITYSNKSIEIKKTVDNDYTFCYGSIAVTLFGNGDAKQVRFGVNGIVVKTVLGKWSAYGTGDPQLIRIKYDGAELEYTYQLIHDGLGKPNVLMDGEGRQYRLCKKSNSESLQNGSVPIKLFCGKFQDQDNDIAITISEDKGKLIATAVKNGKVISAKFKCGNSSKFQGQIVDYGVPISWDEILFTPINLSCPNEPATVSTYTFAVLVWKDDKHVKIRGSYQSQMNTIEKPDTSAKRPSNQIKRDPEQRKDFANVYYNPKYTLFDFLTDEPILPDSSGLYKIYYATNEDKTPRSLQGNGEEIAKHSVYKFKNFLNCNKWCTGR
jgi:hypothetical protein